MAAQHFSGAGDPNAVVFGNPGDVYQDETGAFWLKESDVGTNTGWAALSVAAAVLRAQRTSHALARAAISATQEFTAGQNFASGGLDSDFRMFDTALVQIPGTGTGTTGLVFSSVSGDGNRDFPYVFPGNSPVEGVTGFIPEWADASTWYSSGDSTIAILVLRDGFVLVHEGASSAAPNRLSLPNGVNVVLNHGDGALLRYDAGISRWVLVGE